MLPNFHFSIERWRKNEEYGVWVSNQGRVKLIKNRKLLEPRVDDNGYLLVFSEKGAIKIHRLVAYTWLGGKRNDKYTVDHINSNKRDNSVKNLRWVEQQVNLDYAKFTQYKTKNIKETNPKKSIEEEEKEKGKLATIYNTGKTKEERVGEFLRLLRINDIKVYYNKKELRDYAEICLIKESFAREADDIGFIYKIIVSSKSKKQYCKGCWRIEVVNND